MRLEHDDVWPEQMVEQMRELGLFGATISPEYGGLGLSAQLYARIVDAHLGSVDVAHRHLQFAPDDGAAGARASAPT